MTTTAGDIAQRSLKRILVQAADAPLEEDEYADYLDSLNDFMFALESDGIRLGYTAVDNVSDILTVPPGAIRGIVANMAVEVSPDYGGTISAALIKQAQDGMETLRRLGRAKIKASYPSTLPTGAGNQGSYQLDEQFYGPSVSGLLSLAGGSETTVIGTADTPVIVYAFWERVRAAGLRTDIGGRITSLQEDDVSVAVTVTLSATGSGAYTFRLMHNGVSVATDTETLSSTPVDISITKSLTLEPSDYLEVWVEGDSHTNDLVVIDGQFEVA